MILRGMLATLGFYAFAAVLLFTSAGRWDVPAFWAWLAFMAGGSVAFLPILERTSPGLIEERMRPGPGNRDRLGAGAGAVLLLLTLVIAGFDAGRRFGPQAVPVPLQLLAWAGFVAGYVIVAWSMSVNRYFSSAVRIQSDRGQVVVRSGPYAYVRHPGYAGGLLFMACTGLALGSWWATLPTLPMIAWFVQRTRIEDAMLRAELHGYSEYAHTVRHRLVPGLW